MSMKQSKFQIVDLSAQDIPEIIEFADLNIGKGYYTTATTKEILNAASAKDPTTCLGMRDLNTQKLIAIRISLPPGTWMNRFSYGQLTEKWGVDPKNVGYFKSLFLDPSYRGQKLGPRLSAEAERRMWARGALAIVTHSWKESPNNSSTKYLTKMGFQVVGELPHYWAQVDYDCSGCHNRPCSCTAVEMIKYENSGRIK